MSTEENKNILEKKVDSKFTITKKRKFHDMWALILYIICLSGFIALSIFFAKRNQKEPELKISFQKSRLSKKDQEIVGSSMSDVFFASTTCEFFIFDFIKIVLAPIAVFIAVLILMYLMPGVFFHLLFIACIVFLMAMAGIGAIDGNIRSAISCSVWTIISSLAYACIFRRLKFAVQPFKMTMRITWGCSHLFVGFISFFTLIAIGISYAVNTTLVKKYSAGVYSIMSIFCFFVAIWTMFLISTVSQTVMSGIAVHYLVHDSTGSQLVKSSLTIVLYSLGSACFAALLLAIVYTLKNSTRNAMDDDNNGKANLIMLILIYTCLSFLEDFLHFLTSWAMTVVALKGCKLTKAMKSAMFDIRTGFITTIITAYLILGMIAIFSACMGVILCCFTQLFYLKEILPDSQLGNTLRSMDIRLLNEHIKMGIYVESNNKRYLPVLNKLPIFYFIVTVVFLYGFASLIQKIMEMIYLVFTEEPSVLERKDIKVYKSMEEEADYKSVCC